MDSTLLLLFLLALVCLVSLLYYKFAYAPFQVLKKHGIKTTVPKFFYGHYKERSKMGLIKYFEMLHKEYGPIAGHYIGQLPVVTITDLDLIKKITVKDFNNFQDRERIPDLIQKKERFANGLLAARDEYWKLSRRILSPTFSSFKLKAMVPLIQNSVATLVDVFQEHADTGKSFEVFKIFSSFTMETIMATGFGRVVEIQKGKSDPLTDAAATLFANTQEDKKTSAIFYVTFISNFPWMVPIFRFLLKGGNMQKKFYIIHDAAMKLIKERREENKPGKYKDLLQLMMDASIEDAAAQDDDGKSTLSDAEISSHSLTFMLAGYETTSNALSYTSYLLALNPEIQEKLQNEIESYYQDNPDASLYQATTDIEYLDMVLQESLRLYPPAPAFARECTEAYRYKDITIPKRAVVVIPAIIIHKDPKYWEDPDKFDPLRFTAEEKAKRPPLSHVPFGFGPRSCIGMRFALMEAKMALIEVLRRFTFVRAPDTEVPIETIVGITMAPKNGIYLKLATKI